jgi:hypothetical protein
MGAKKNAAGDESDAISDLDGNSTLMEMIRNMNTQLTNITSRLDKINTIETEVKGLRVLLNDLKQENAVLKTEARINEQKMQQMNERNNQLENRLNKLEQHHRSWGARILNIPLSKEEETNNNAVRDKVYNLALLPILTGAVEKKLLMTVPTSEQLLELAHVLPGNAAGQHKTVIMRFYNRNLRDMCFHLKKHYAPREPPSPGATGSVRARSSSNSEAAGGYEGKGRYAFPLYEDLSRATFQKMRAIANDGRVKACWTVKGQIKFTLHSKPEEVRKVESLLDSLDSIIK